MYALYMLCGLVFLHFVNFIRILRFIWKGQEMRERVLYPSTKNNVHIPLPDGLVEYVQKKDKTEEV